MPLKVLRIVILHHLRPRWHRLVHKWPIHQRWRVSPGLTQQLCWPLCAITYGSRQPSPDRCAPELRVAAQVAVEQLLTGVRCLVAMLQQRQAVRGLQQCSVLALSLPGGGLHRKWLPRKCRALVAGLEATAWPSLWTRSPAICNTREIPLMSMAGFRRRPNSSCLLRR